LGLTVHDLVPDRVTLGGIVEADRSFFGAVSARNACSNILNGSTSSLIFDHSPTCKIVAFQIYTLIPPLDLLQTFLHNDRHFTKVR
jgi:hypothetical protein